MGGSSYDRDVGYSSSSGSFSSGGTSSSRAKEVLGNTHANSQTSPFNKTVETDSESPIVIALDVTGSNIEFARIVYDKAPMLHGQIEQQGYLKNFEICFAAVGDAYSDSAPLQVCDFQYGKALDAELKKIFLEGNGGGQQTESYELAAHFFSKKCKIPKAKSPFFFFIGDEAPYPKLEAYIAQEVMGSSLKNDLSSEKIFGNLFSKFQENVFFLQNPYYGRSSETTRTNKIKSEWVEYIGIEHAQHVLPVHEEKSVIDIILGTIAMVSRSRDMNQYLTDMGKRGQSEERRGHVKKSLSGLETALVPHVKMEIAPASETRRSSGAKRL